MGLIILRGILLALLLVAAWLILRRPARQFAEELQVDHARALFRARREWLEARFVGALARLDPLEGLRWDEAHWHDEILWARDRQSRVFLALVGVHFGEPFDDPTEPLHRHSTAVFEFRKGRWMAEGKRLDEVRPAEAVSPGHRFEPVVLHRQRGVS
jgi:hypothetical protein